MRLDRTSGEEQLLSDLGIASAGGHRSQNVQFPTGDAQGAEPWRHSRVATAPPGWRARTAQQITAVPSELFVSRSLERGQIRPEPRYRVAPAVR